jgi:hypothetical protein
VTVPVEVAAVPEVTESPAPTVASTLPAPIQAGSPGGATEEPLVVGDMQTASSVVPSALFDTSGVGLLAALLGGMVAVAVCAGVTIGIRQRKY